MHIKRTGMVKNTAMRRECENAKCNWQMLISINSRLRLFIGYIHKRGFNWPRIRLIFSKICITQTGGDADYQRHYGVT